MPSGIEGIVIDTMKFSRRLGMSDEERKAFDKQARELESKGNERVAAIFTEMIEAMEKVVGKALVDEDEVPLVRDQTPKAIYEHASKFKLSQITGRMRSEDRVSHIEEIYGQYATKLENALDEKTVEDWQLRFEGEEHYIRNKSVSYDLILIVLTVVFMVRKAVRRVFVRRPRRAGRLLHMPSEGRSAEKEPA